MNFTDDKTPYTRIIEHKHFEFINSPSTILSIELPIVCCDLKPTIATLFAWFVAVIFACITNRKYVFSSYANNILQITKECAYFLSRKF